MTVLSREMRWYSRRKKTVFVSHFLLGQLRYLYIIEYLKETRYIAYVFPYICTMQKETLWYVIPLLALQKCFNY